MIVVFLFMAGLAMCSWLWKTNKAFSLLVGLAMISTCYPVYRGPLWLPLVCIMAGAAWYLFWVHVDIKDISILNAVCVLSLINTSLVISQYFYFDPIFHKTTDYYALRCTGFFVNTNFTSAFIAVCLPAFFRKGWRWLIPVSIAGLLITQTTGSIIAIVIALAVAAIVMLNNIQKIIVIFALLCVVFAYSFIDKPGLSRWQDWSLFYKLDRGEDGKYKIGEGKTFTLPLKPWYSGKAWISPQEGNSVHIPYIIPILGLGLGSFNAANVFHRGQLYTHVHNDFLEGMIDMGWPIIPIVCLFFYHIWARFGGRELAGIALLTYSIIAGVSYPTSIATISAICLVWLAMFDRKECIQ